MRNLFETTLVVGSNALLFTSTNHGCGKGENTQKGRAKKWLSHFRVDYF